MEVLLLAKPSLDKKGGFYAILPHNFSPARAESANNLNLVSEGVEDSSTNYPVARVSI